MKYLLMTGLLFSQFAQAELVKCVSQDKKYEVLADMNFGAKKVAAMVYLKNGERYRTFRNLPMKADGGNYTVLFDESALYMDLAVGKDKIFGGVFLPRNNIFMFDRKIVCSRE